MNSVVFDMEWNQPLTGSGKVVHNVLLGGMGCEALPPTYDLQKLFGLQVPEVPRQCGLLRALEVLEEPAYTAHDALNDAANTVTVMRHMDLDGEALEKCLVGCDPESKSYYLRSDDYSTCYPNFRGVLQDRNVNVFVSPINGLKVACPRWVTLDTGVLGAIAADREGLEYFVRLRVRRRRQGYRASRQVWLSNEHFRSLCEMAAG